MAETLEQIIADYEREHAGSPGQMSAMAATDVDRADLQRRVYEAAKHWTADEIKQQKDIQKAEQDKAPTENRKAVIDGLQKASEAVATGQDGDR